MASSLQSIKAQYRQWLVIAGVVASSIVVSCLGEGFKDDDEEEEEEEAENASVDMSLSPGQFVPDGKLPAPMTATEAPPDGFKVAFIGDTSAGTAYKKVLQLIREERADLVLVQGDLTYGSTSPTQWFAATDNEINQAQPGSPAPVTIPYFAAKGNHDVQWGGLASGFNARFAQWGVQPTHNDPSKVNYALAYKGIEFVFIDSDRETTPTREQYVVDRLTNDTHIWRICAWHRNMRASNVGPKGNEMKWPIYEACRKNGAIVAQGHSHTYSRSKTLTNDATQTIDPDCNSPFNLCVGPGKHFFFDSSLGGQENRPLDANAARMPHWAAKYRDDDGALFIRFNIDGDPRKAEGYFKTVGGATIDPPPNGPAADGGPPRFIITSTN